MSTSGLLDQQAARCVFGCVFLFRSGAAEQAHRAFCWRFLSRQAPAKRSLPTVFSSPLGKACEPALLSLAASICQLTARPRWGFCRGSLDLISRRPRAGAQFPPARALRLSSEIVQTHGTRLKRFRWRADRDGFAAEWPVRRPMGTPARRKGSPRGLSAVPACRDNSARARLLE